MKTTLERIDHFLENKQGHGFREHLGASIIGRECARQLWYNFRWTTRSFHKGRILRLFQRGHEEEDRIAKFLRQAGVHVLQEDPETGEQFRILDHDGHLGGSLDGKLFDTPEYPLDWILAEYKTHGEKSYKKVSTQGVQKAKYEHYVQMQIYMHYEELPAALYIAVNKNNDDLYMPIVVYDEEVALKYIDRAHMIIHSRTPPPRIPNASPGWFVCRFCDFSDVCHIGLPKEKNCRTCMHSRPEVEAKWVCEKFDEYPLTKKDQLRGCIEHTPIPED